jgi:PPE-repeat protein
MLEFAAIPPEINSARMYAGPGSGPLIAASAAWDALADDLYVTATAYAAVIVDLTSSWLGPSSVSMSTAADTYVSWITATAAHAELTAAQAQAAVAAYEVAFALTVPPEVIAANRALLLALVATNFFGQNTPAIMATEADYVEMWAQDAAAMYGYAGASSVAAALTPFTAPLQNTNSAGLTGLAAAATHVAGTTAGTGMQVVSPLSSALSTPLGSALSTPLTTASMPSALQGLASAATSVSSASPLSPLATMTSSSTALTSATSLVSGLTTSSASMSTSSLSAPDSAVSLMYSIQSGPVLGSAIGNGWAHGAGVIGSPGMGDAVMTANVGRAASLGALSVPEGWTSAAPAFSQVASAVPGGASAMGAAPPIVPGGQGTPVGPPLSKLAASESPSASQGARYFYRPAVVQRPVYTG